MRPCQSKLPPEEVEVDAEEAAAEDEATPRLEANYRLNSVRKPRPVAEVVEEAAAVVVDEADLRADRWSIPAATSSPSRLMEKPIRETSPSKKIHACSFQTRIAPSAAAR